MTFCMPIILFCYENINKLFEYSKIYFLFATQVGGSLVKWILLGEMNWKRHCK